MSLLLRRIALPAIIWGMAVSLMILPLPAFVRGSAALFVLMLPGGLLTAFWFAYESDPPSLVLLGLCGALGLYPLLLMLLHEFPGPLPASWVLIGSAVLLTLVIAVLLRQPSLLSISPWHPYMLLAIALIPGAMLRLLYLGTAEFQGDEARALLFAMDAIRGRDDILLLHKKGPIEALLPAGPLALTGQMTELVARLPFALAGVGIILGVYVLGRSLFTADHQSRFSSATGLAAAVFVALDGLLVGFARIVQYQSVLVLFAVGAFWCAWRFYQGAMPQQRYLWSGAMFSALAVLTHYDAVLLLPVPGLLLLAGVLRRGLRHPRAIHDLVVGFVLFSAILGSFYIPFVLNAEFASTASYLWGRAQDGSGSLFYNNLDRYFLITTVYSTTYQMIALASVLVLGAMITIWRYVRPRWLALSAMLLLLIASVIQATDSQRFVVPVLGNWAIVGFGLPLLLLLIAKEVPIALRMSWLWFTVPFVTMAFVLVRPGTHYYIIHAAAALVAAHTVVWIFGWLRERLALLSWGFAALWGAVAALAFPYLFLVFVRQNPEYAQRFPQERPAIYQAAYGDDLPRIPLFGFPHQAGWKAVGLLLREGELAAPVNSNDDYYTMQWYTLGSDICERNARTFLYVPYPLGRTSPVENNAGDRALLTQVMRNGETTMEIYSNVQNASIPRTLDVQDYSAAFDNGYVAGLPLAPTHAIVTMMEPSEDAWAVGPQLTATDIDFRWIGANRPATLWLNWEHATLAGDAELHVALVAADGTAVQQLPPVCSRTRLADWSDGAVSTFFRLNDDWALPAGAYQVQVQLLDAGRVIPLANGQMALPVATVEVLP